MKRGKTKLFLASLLMLSLMTPLWAQKTPTRVIFAVLNDGKMIEPVAKVENGKLMQTVSGGDEEAILKAFSKTYYKPKTVYNLIFGGNLFGTVSVVKNDPNSDCAKNMAEINAKPLKPALKGFIMALATNVKPTKVGSGLRRRPTPNERAEVDKLVTAKFAEYEITGKKLEYHNLTGLDIDNNKTAEFVGTYWMATGVDERAMMFVIAEKGKNGKYELTHHKFDKVAKESVMSGDIKDVDSGIYHELLLDVLDFNNDGVAEIFTYQQSFEGAGFYAYQRKKGNWEMVLESSNYHCGY